MFICEIIQSIMLVGLVIQSMLAYTNYVFVCLYDDDDDEDEGYGNGDGGSIDNGK